MSVWACVLLWVFPVWLSAGLVLQYLWWGVWLGRLYTHVGDVLPVCLPSIPQTRSAEMTAAQRVALQKLLLALVVCVGAHVLLDLSQVITREAQLFSLWSLFMVGSEIFVLLARHEAAKVALLPPAQWMVFAGLAVLHVVPGYVLPLVYHYSTDSGEPMEVSMYDGDL